MKRVIGGAIAVLFLLKIPVQEARADSANSVAAEALFKEGIDLLDKGKTEEACDKFGRSNQLDAAVGTLLNLGDCLDKLGKTASAWDAYRRAIGLAESKGDDKRLPKARARAAAIEPRLARLTIATPAALPPSFAVTRGGAPVDANVFNVPVPVDPGPQKIEASAPGRKPWSTTVTLSDGGKVTVQVPALAAEQPTTTENNNTHPRDDDPSSTTGGSTQRTIGIGLEIGGGVILVAGLALGAVAMVQWNAVQQTCPDGKCPSEADRRAQSADADSVSTFTTLSTVTSVVGLVALGAGVLLHLTAPAKTRVGLAPIVDRSAVGLSAVARW